MWAKWLITTVITCVCVRVITLYQNADDDDALDVLPSQ